MTDDIHPDGLPVPRRYFAMLAIAIGITMAVLDGTVVNVALPSIARELGATPAAAVWIVNAYQLVIVATLLPLAALGERVGYRRVYQAGIVVFTLGSLACALSDSLPQLVAARVLQGLGGSAIMSMNGALVRHTYPDAMLGRGVGLNGLVVSFAAAVAPSLAAGILAVGPWPWLFAVNVPFGLLNTWLALRYLPRSETSRRPFDRVSALLSAAMFGLFFVGADGLARGGGAWAAAAALAAAVAAGVALVRRNTGAPAPLIPVDLLRNPVFALSVTASICAFVAFIIAFVALPFYFQSVLGPRPGRDRPPDDPLAGGARPRRAARGAALRPDVGGGPRRLRHGASRHRARAHEPLAGGCEHARHRLAHGALRPRLRLLPGAEQPGDARRGAAHPLGRGRRHAGHGAAARDDRRRHDDGARLPLRAGGGRAGQPRHRHRLRGRRGGGEPPPPATARGAGLTRVGSACWQGR